MKNVLVPQSEATTSAISPTQEYLHAVRLDDTLPEWLVQDAEGRPFAPVRLGEISAQTLPGQLTQIMRIEPVGGAETLIEANAQRVLQHAQERLYQRLSLTQSGGQTRVWLIDLQAALRETSEHMATRAQAADHTYHSAHGQLRQWQERTSRRAAGGFWNGFARLMMGDGEQVSLPQAVIHWNAREQWQLSRLALRGALGVLRQILDVVTYLRDHLDALTAHILRLRDEARQHMTNSAPSAPMYEPLTLRLDATTIAERLAQRTISDDIIGAWLSRLSQALRDDSDTIVRDVQAFAQQEATQRLAALDILALLELEVRALNAHEPDSLLLVGQGLLDALGRCPTPVVAPTAHPRVETIQITPDGQPVYSLEGLHAAAYGAPGDRIGFVQVQMGLALQDLRLIRDGMDTFNEALQQRNFYALEALAEAWERRTVMAPAPRHDPTLDDGATIVALTPVNVVNNGDSETHERASR